jgi:hypothetical protein
MQRNQKDLALGFCDCVSKDNVSSHSSGKAFIKTSL